MADARSGESKGPDGANRLLEWSAEVALVFRVPSKEDFDAALDAAHQLAARPHPEGTKYTGSEIRRLCVEIRGRVGTDAGVGEKTENLHAYARSPAWLGDHWLAFQHDCSSLTAILERLKRGGTP